MAWVIPAGVGRQCARLASCTARSTLALPLPCHACAGVAVDLLDKKIVVLDPTRLLALNIREKKSKNMDVRRVIRRYSR
jgi:hypothetical protein